MNACHYYNFTPWVQTTDACDLACEYCYISKQPRNMTDNVYESILKHTFKLLDDGFFDIATLRLAGGEPLLVFDQWRPHMENFLAKANGRGQVDLLTNLNSLNDQHIKFLLESNAIVSISLDGVRTSKPDHSGKSSAQRVQNGILRFLEKGVKLKNLSITTVITKSGLSELPELASWIAKHKMPWLIQLNHFFQGELNVNEAYIPFANSLDILMANGYDLRQLRFNGMNPLVRNEGCGACLNSVAFGTQGEIYPCQTAIGKATLGNITQIQNLWKVMQEQRLYNAGNNFQLPHECNACAINQWCHGGCKLNNLPSHRKHYCNVAQHLMLTFMKNCAKQEKQAA